MRVAERHPQTNSGRQGHRILSVALVAGVLLLTSSACGRQEGPFGVHVGDSLIRNGTKPVTAVGDDWFEVKGGYRYTAEMFEAAPRIDCAHR